MALLRGETVTMETDWFTLQDARLQLAAVQRPVLRHRGRGVVLPDRRARPRASTASACCRSPRPRSRAWTCSATTGDLWEEIALEHGHVADRSKWRLVGPMHLAETREQAEQDVEYGIAQFSRYFTHVLPAGPVQGDTPEEIIENNKAAGFAVIGTPDDAIAKIEELVEASNGGFGAFLLFGHDWATPAATLPSATSCSRST